MYYELVIVRYSDINKLNLTMASRCSQDNMYDYVGVWWNQIAHQPVQH